MNKNIKIASQITIKDWEELKMKLDPENNNLWDMAYKLFFDRIRERYLNPINAILNLKQNTGEGFSAVNLQCSLIETIESFYNGWISDKSKYYHRNLEDLAKYPNAEGKKEDVSGKFIFKKFFLKRTDQLHQIDGDDFYLHVRCALLHEVQTKNNWVIRCNNEKPFYYEEEGMKVINRNKFQKELERVIEKYKEELLTGEDKIELRKNFICKFENICSKS